MNVRACLALLVVLGGSAAAPGQFAIVPLGDPALPDIVVTIRTNSSTFSRVEWTEYDPAQENVTSVAPYPTLLETPFPVDQVRSCSFAELDGDELTDWVLLVHHDEGRLSTVEHWEGDESGMALQRVLFEAAPLPAEMIALTFGDFDGDTSPDILTIEDPTGNGPQVVRHYEQAVTEWFLVAEFPVGAPTDRFMALTVGSLDGDSLTDVLLIRDDEEGDVSAIDHYEFASAQLVFVRNLVTAPRATHRFQALDLGSLNGERTDILVLDWFFYQSVHEIQRWELTDDGIGLFQILREAIPPAERLIDISFVPGTEDCPPECPPENDDCDPELIPTLHDGANAHDNRCGTTDGPGDDGCYPNAADGTLHDQLWYQYTATCTGQLSVSMCEDDGGMADYDAYMVVYGAGTPTCQCPIDTSIELGCGDDTCGVVEGPATVAIPVTPGNCYTIAVGGWNDEGGTGNSRGTGVIQVKCSSCVPSSPPAPEMLAAPPLHPSLEGGTGMDATGVSVNAKNRFVSIKMSDAGRTQAIRVRFVSLPPPFDAWNYENSGQDFFAGAPREVCENSGKGLETPPEECPNGLPTDTFWTAPLVCDQGQAHYMDWHGWCNAGTCVGGLKPGASCITDDDCVEYVHIYHEGLVPTMFGDPNGAAIYDIQAVDQTCNAQEESSYSAALTMIQSRWGDVCGPGPGGACSSVSDGIVDVANDVLGVLDKFANLSNLQKARADLEPGDFGFNNGPDFKVNVANDVLFCLAAFTGSSYPFKPGNPCGPG